LQYDTSLECYGGVWNLGNCFGVTCLVVENLVFAWQCGASCYRLLFGKYWKAQCHKYVYYTSCPFIMEQLVRFGSLPRGKGAQPELKATHFTFVNVDKQENMLKSNGWTNILLF